MPRLDLKRRYQIELLKQLWHQLTQRYLLDLRTAYSVKNPNSDAKFKVGGTVLIEGNTKNQLLWKLSKITRTLPEGDNEIRCYELKTSEEILKRIV